MPAAKTTKTTTVVIADQHPVARCGIRSVLGRGFRVVGEASDGLEAVRLVKKHEPDVLITDIELPLQNGLTMARELLERKSPTKVLILSASHGDFDIHQAMRAKVCGYHFKSDEISGLPAAVRKIHRGGTSYAPDVQRYIEIHERDPSPPRPINLSVREQQVLQLLNEGRLDKDIGELLGISAKTVNVHMQSASKKTGLKGRVALALWAQSTGMTQGN